jgi:lysophospholipase L1-like esterase
MYELADEVGGAVFDQFEIMGGLHSMEKWRLAKLAQNDRVHFTKTGYELMGKLLFNAIIRELDIRY